MSKVNRVDCALLPSCAKTVSNKLQRAHYVTIIWGNADNPNPDYNLEPLQFGWKEDRGCYTPDWYSGATLPVDLFKAVEKECDEDEIVHEMEATWPQEEDEGEEEEGNYYWSGGNGGGGDPENDILM